MEEKGEIDDYFWVATLSYETVGFDVLKIDASFRLIELSLIILWNIWARYI